jgi:hypothetical protein
LSILVSISHDWCMNIAWCLVAVSLLCVVSWFGPFLNEEDAEATCLSNERLMDFSDESQLRRVDLIGSTMFSFHNTLAKHLERTSILRRS